MRSKEEIIEKIIDIVKRQFDKMLSEDPDTDPWIDWVDNEVSFFNDLWKIAKKENLREINFDNIKIAKEYLEKRPIDYLLLLEAFCSKGGTDIENVFALRDFDDQEKTNNFFATLRQKN